MQAALDRLAEAQADLALTILDSAGTTPVDIGQSRFSRDLIPAQVVSALKARDLVSTTPGGRVRLTAAGVSMVAARKALA